MLALVAASALLGPGLEYGSGQWWNTLYAEGIDGLNHPHTAWQLAWPKDGGNEYRITTYNAEYNQPSERLDVYRYKGSIRFRSLAYHANPVGDYYEEKGQWIKQFPSALLVAHGDEKGRPVTLVWRMADSVAHRPVLAIKVYDGDASQLNGEPRKSALMGGLLFERARARWLPAADRPSGFSPDAWLQRTWEYREGKFAVKVSWRKKDRLDVYSGD